MNPVPVEVSFVDVASVLSRHRKKVLAISGTILFMTLAILLWWPKRYSSEARLFVMVGRDSVTLDPTASTGEMINVLATRENEINSVVEMLRSRSILESVVRQIGPDAILAPSEDPSCLEALMTAAGEAKSRLVSLVITDDGDQTEEAVEAAIEELAARLQISSAKETSVIDVSCSAQSPELAQQIVQNLVDAYTEQHVRVHGTTGSEKFFQDQVAQLGLRLEDTKRALLETKNQMEIVSIEGQRKLLEDQKLLIEQRRLQNNSDIAASEAKVDALQKSLAAVDSVLTARVEGLASPAADGMRQKLYELEIQERDLASKYQDDHPKLIVVRKQLENIKEIHHQESASRSQQTIAVNPNHQQLEFDFLTEQSSLSGYNATQRALDEEYRRVLVALRKLNTQAPEIEKLERESEILEASYRTYADNLEMARIDGALRKQRITNVNVVQEPTLVRQPSSPNSLLVIGVGLILALFGGVGLAFLSESLDQSFKSAAEVESVLGVPVLISIPRSSRQRINV